MQIPAANLANPANCLCFNLRKATRALTQSYDAALKPAGITTPQFTLLTLLEKRGPISLSPLAGALGMDRTTLTRNLKPLQRDGLVASASGDDRRVRLLDLTAAGRSRLRAAEPLWRAVQLRVAESFGHQPATALLAELSRISGKTG
ncbi:MAG: MarR family winged helix-turn-helix transcriptional regulator [Hyphomicrobiales bacterium]|nr:MarR family winged helix-turn-helix transcriptional regulator [Hyphomicrobiales bacterium]